MSFFSTPYQQDFEFPHLQIRNHHRARRLSLRLDAKNRCVVLTVPKRVSYRKAMAFARENRDWIDRHIAELPPKSDFIDGGFVPVAGVPCKISHHPEKLRGLTRIDAENNLIVYGQAEHLPRRVKDFLIKTAREMIAEKAEQKSQTIDKTIRQISVRDTQSRWGSCTSDGKLSFSWRLILAPVFVLDYVVAHEVAHLRYMSHGPRFWQLCDRLCDDGPGARAWLKENGNSLHQYG